MAAGLKTCSGGTPKSLMEHFKENLCTGLTFKTKLSCALHQSIDWRHFPHRLLLGRPCEVLMPRPCTAIWDGSRSFLVNTFWGIGNKKNNGNKKKYRKQKKDLEFLPDEQSQLHRGTAHSKWSYLLSRPNVQKKQPLFGRSIHPLFFHIDSVNYRLLTMFLYVFVGSWFTCLVSVCCLAADMLYSWLASQFLLVVFCSVQSHSFGFPSSGLLILLCFLVNPHVSSSDSAWESPKLSAVNGEILVWWPLRFFVLSASMYKARPDLVNTGRPYAAGRHGVAIKDLL